VVRLGYKALAFHDREFTFSPRSGVRPGWLMLSLDPPSNQVEEQLQQACAELSRRLRSGQDCHAEDVASGFPSVASNPNQLLELVLAELTTRRQLGQHLQPEEWYARYPQWRERLWLWFVVENEVTSDPSPNVVVETVVQTPQPTPAKVGPEKVFGRYELLGKLGQGGMGVVHRARDTALNRVVALKRIRAGVLAGSEDVERFYREARAAAQLKHPYIIGVYDIDRLEDEHYLTMEYAAGGSLAHRLRRFQGEPRKAVALMEKVARAVHHAHSKGILHRDLKPGNILLDENEEPRISDFGLAKFLDGDAELTQSGAVIGTPAYMAPEQTIGRPGGSCVQSDVWALGVILYELLTGRRPFPGDSSQQVMEQIQRTAPPRPRALCPKLDRDLETVILKCLEKEPAWRYPSAEALADDLARWLRGESVQARPVPWLRRAGRWLRRHPRLSTAIGGLMLLTGTLGAVLYLNDPDRPVRDIQARLAKGQAVTLIGETGLPRWYHWRAGSKRATLGPNLSWGGLDVVTYHISLLELLPDPQQQCYRFAAEVRMNGTVTGEVGLYFLGEERPTAHGPEQYCCALTFADRGILAGRAILKLFRVWEVNGEQRQREELYMQEIPLPPQQVLRLSQALTAQALAIPVGMIPAYPRVYTAAGVAALGASQCEWRQLVVDVTPEGIDVSLDGCRVGKLDQAQLQAAAAAWWRVQAHQIPAGTPPPLLDVRGRLGLLVKMADASFRNVTVSPLPRVTPH
jgi:hypothetical protein